MEWREFEDLRQDMCGAIKVLEESFDRIAKGN